MSEFLCAIRCNQIRSAQYLTSQQQHGRGIGAKAESRVTMPNGPRAFAWTNLAKGPKVVEVGDRSDHTNLTKAMQKRLADTGATVRKNASRGLHVLAIVSDAWMSEGESEGRQVRRLFNEARRWGEKTFGEGSVIASRFDLNERGRSAVDLFICPVRSQRIGRGRVEKKMVAPSAALEELAVRMGRNKRQGYAALQDSWAAHCSERLDPRIKRGVPKGITQAIHLDPEDYKKKENQRRRSAVGRLLGAFQWAAPQLFKKVLGDDGDLVRPLIAKKPPAGTPIYERTIRNFKRRAGNFRRLSSWLWRSGRWPEFAESGERDLVDAAYKEAEQDAIDRKRQEHEAATKQKQEADEYRRRMLALARSGLRQRDPAERQAAIREARAWCKERGISYKRQRRST